MSQNLTNIANALREVVEPDIRDQLESKTVLMANLARNKGVKSMDGDEVKLSLRDGRNVGIGARAESGTLPTAGQQQYKKATVTAKYNYGRMQLTGQVIEATKSDKRALVSALTSESEGLKTDFSKNTNRQLFGRGDGVVSTVGTGATSATLPLTVGETGRDATQYLYAGTIIDIWDARTGGAQEVNSIAIASVDSATQVTLASSQTFGTTSFLFYEDSRGNEMMGLRGLVDDSSLITTFQGISAATNTFWRANESENSGTLRPLTEALMHTSFLAANKFGNVSLMISDFELQAEYGQILSADRRYGETLELKGGFKGVMFNGVALVADIDCTKNHMYFLDMNHVSLEELAPVQFMDRDGAMLSRVANTDAYEATLFYYAELATDFRRPHSKLADVGTT